jgi:UDP-2,4-diacetamido-2,4,6-trideoxy-beta-L-altropyranose hydrolase
MIVVFRVDSSSTIGSGHVVRCVTLATELRKRGARCLFICRNLPGNITEYVMRRNFDLAVLPFNSTSERYGSQNTDQYAEWLGVDWKTDALQTIAELSGTKIDWLILDHYGLDSLWEIEVGRCAARTLVIDDLANRSHCCDVLLDQNIGGDDVTRYARLIDTKTTLQLLGPKFSLLQDEYRLPLNPIETSSDEERILVYFGLNDTYRLTLCFVNLLKAASVNYAEIVVVYPTSGADYKELSTMRENWQCLTIVEPSNSLANELSRATLAIGACGTHAIERLVCNVPAIVVTIADNQVAIAEYLSSLGLIKVLGHAADGISHITNTTIDDSIKSIRKTFSDARRLIDLDSLGTHRVSDVILLGADVKLSARFVNSNDIATLFRWVNDPMVRAMSLKSEDVSLVEHTAWFDSGLNGNDRYIAIVETQNNIPVGQVRIDVVGKLGLLDYSIDRIFRGNGLSKSLVRKGIDLIVSMVDVGVIRAVVKSINVVSQSVLLSVGFKITDKNHDGSVVMEYVNMLKNE